MMIMLARAFAGLAALFGIVLGVAFLIQPVSWGAAFFLSPMGIPGMAVLRADMTAFFLTGGILAAIGGWKQNPAWLVTPIMLFAIAIIGRTISLVADGVTPGAFLPMIVEAALVAMLVFAHRTFSNRTGR
jgi:peptidoglycan/LPS O-acetylase OafA/YrhL